MKDVFSQGMFCPTRKGKKRSIGMNSADMWETDKAEIIKTRKGKKKKKRTYTKTSTKLVSSYTLKARVEEMEKSAKILSNHKKGNRLMKSA